MKIFPESIRLGEEFDDIRKFLGGNPTKGSSMTKLVCGIAHRFGRGGVHAALDNYEITENVDFKIIDIDFSSFYPFIMLRYVPWFWKGMAKEQFQNLLVKRITAKFNADCSVSDSLKKTIAVSYGLARLENEDMGFRVCAVGQLILVDLLDKLQEIDDITVINSNTDGVIVAYPPNAEDQLLHIVEEFKQRIQIPIEYLEIHKLIQKNINCYIAELGASYTIKDGVKKILNPDSHRIKIRGLPNDIPIIVKDAIASNLLNDESIEGMIYNCMDLSQFAIYKSDFDKKAYRWKVGSQYLIIDQPVAIYAAKDKSLGIVGVLGDNKRLKIVSYTSNHSIADTKGKMVIDALDKKFYVAMALELKGKLTKDLRKERLV